MAPSDWWLPPPVTLLIPLCVRRLWGAANGPFKTDDSWNTGQRWLKQLGEHREGWGRGWGAGTRLAAATSSPCFSTLSPSFALTTTEKTLDGAVLIANQTQTLISIKSLLCIKTIWSQIFTSRSWCCLQKQRRLLVERQGIPQLKAGLVKAAFKRSQQTTDPLQFATLHDLFFFDWFRYHRYRLFWDRK